METTNSLKTFEDNPRLRLTRTGPNSFKVAGMLHMETAETLREMLLEISASSVRPDLSGAKPPRVDFSEVDVCGTSGVQLLLSAARTMASKGTSVEFAPLSPTVKQAFARFGSAVPPFNNEQTGPSAP
jgi:anti-anti-sigma regulatory factor